MAVRFSRWFVALAALCLAPVGFAGGAGAQAGDVTYSVTPTSGVAGSQFTVTGSGCGADGTGRFVFVTRPDGNFSGNPQTEFTADAAGEFEFTVTVPDTAPGTYSTGIICTEGEAGWPTDNPSAVTFTVVGAAATTTTTTTPRANTTTTVAGAGSQDLDCSDFTSREEAQATLDADRSDPHRLDDDGDGVACEGLPSRGGSPQGGSGSGRTLARTGPDLPLMTGLGLVVIGALLLAVPRSPRAARRG